MTNDDGPRPGVTLEAVQAQAGVPPGRHRHRRQLLPAQRRRRRPRRHERHEGQGARPEPLARVVSTGGTALSPEIMGLGPVEASNLALKRAGMTIGDMDLYEINEAFAAQVIPSADQIGMDYDKLNVNGGAIAIGHPFGATGARITGTLINAPARPGRAVRPRDDVRRRRAGHGGHLRAPQLDTETHRPAERPRVARGQPSPTRASRTALASASGRVAKRS